MQQLIYALFRLYEIVIIIRVLFSWISVDQRNPIVQWIYKLTEPLLEPLRRIVPLDKFGIDISPLLLLLALWLIQQLLFNLLF
jgi:YggT family protein